MHFQYDTCLGLREGLRVFIFFLRFESFRLFAICERIDLYPIYEIIPFFFSYFGKTNIFRSHTLVLHPSGVNGGCRLE